MALKLSKRHDDFHELGDHVRIERGPARIKAVATEALLADENTAPHYHPPKLLKMPNGQVQRITATDAVGKPIELGQEMTYLHHNEPSDQRPWYVYRREVESPRQVVADHDDAGNPIRDKDNQVITKADPEDWVEVGMYYNYDEALRVANEAAELNDRQSKAQKGK